MNENARYRLQRKEAYAIANVIGNRSMPVHTYRWKDIMASGDRAALVEILLSTRGPEEYRIIDTWEGIENAD